MLKKKQNRKGFVCQRKEERKLDSIIINVTENFRVSILNKILSHENKM